MRILIILAMAFLFGGCHRSYLSCRSEYLYPPYLAHIQVNTPNSIGENFYGQQIVVSWDIPKSYKNFPLLLKLKIRYGNREIETVSHLITSLSGWKIFRVINDEYLCKEGVLSFKAEIFKENEVIAQWTHYLWTTIIEV